MILPVVAIVLRLRISQPKGASGKARSLVKLLRFSLGSPRLRDDTPKAPLVSKTTHGGSFKYRDNTSSKNECG